MVIVSLLSELPISYFFLNWSAGIIVLTNEIVFFHNFTFLLKLLFILLSLKEANRSASVDRQNRVGDGLSVGANLIRAVNSKRGTTLR